MIINPKTPIDHPQSISIEARQEIIDWLIAHNYPALPVAPALSAWENPKINYNKIGKDTIQDCPLTADLKPIQIFTGKNPSYIDSQGKPQLLNHRRYQTRLPTKQELKEWFTDKNNGVGTLGGWNNTVWLDFDLKQFPNQEACDAAVSTLLERHRLQQTFIERTHSGGWRIGVRVALQPNFTNFSQSPGGPHIGEALSSGRFTVLAPTIGSSGQPYLSIQRTMPIEVDSLESIGIYSTKNSLGKESNPIPTKEGKVITPVSNSQPANLVPSSIDLTMLGNNASRRILNGDCPTGDRSSALTTATKEWYGWANWAQSNGIGISGDVTTLAHQTGALLGLDSERIERILKTIDPTTCHPAALYRGSEKSCWKKILTLDQVTFERQCPAHIKAEISKDKNNRVTKDNNGNGSGGGYCGGGCMDSDSNDSNDYNNSQGVQVIQRSKIPPFSPAAISQAIKDIINQDLSPSELKLAQIQLRKNNPGLSQRDISHLFETLETEVEIEESRKECRHEVNKLLTLNDQSLNIAEFLPNDLAKPLKDFAQNLNIRPEVCLTSLLVAASSLHKISTELVIQKKQGFSVPPTIFAGLVAESGQKKSPILKAIIQKPISVLQGEKRDVFQALQAQYERDIINWEKCKSKERSSLFPNGKPKQPRQELYYFTNTTGEGLLYQYQAHPEKALLALVDELVGLFASQNKYSGGRGSDRQDILSAFDGTGATVLRASGTTADIDGILLSIYGTIQPEVLKRLMRDSSDPDGQWARFLFVNQPLAASTLMADDDEDVDLNEHLLSYYRAIEKIPVRKYRLSPEAFKRYQLVYNELEQLRTSNANPGMRAVYSKMEGYIGRTGLNLHVINELASGKTLPAEEVSLQAIEKAIELASFYIGQVKLIHANCVPDKEDMAPQLAKIVTLSKQIEASTGSGWIKARAVQSGYDSRHRPKPTAIRSWFRELEKIGIGSIRGNGTRVEYSWNSLDLALFKPTPPKKRKKKVEKSGEKGITSPPHQSKPPQDFQEKVETVDNLPDLKNATSHSPTNFSPSNNVNNSQIEVNTDAENIAQLDSDSEQLISDTTQTLPTRPESIISSSNSTSPLSACNDDIASLQAGVLDSTNIHKTPQNSTFSCSLESENRTKSTEWSQARKTQEVNGSIQLGLILSVSPTNQQLKPTNEEIPLKRPMSWEVVISPAQPASNQESDRSCSTEDPADAAEPETANKQHSTEYARVQVTVEEVTTTLEVKEIIERQLIASLVEILTAIGIPGHSKKTN